MHIKIPRECKLELDDHSELYADVLPRDNYVSKL